MCPYTHDDGWTTEQWDQNTPPKEIHTKADSRVLIDVEIGAIDIQVDQDPRIELHTSTLKSGHIMVFGKTDGSKIYYKEIR